MLLSKLKLLLGLLSTSGGRVWMETEHSHNSIDQRRMNEGRGVSILDGFMSVYVYFGLNQTTFRCS